MTVAQIVERAVLSRHGRRLFAWLERTHLAVGVEICAAVQAIFRRSDRVRTITHVSLLSHKQQMICSLLRKRGYDARFVALNTSADHRLNLGYDYGIPIDAPPLKRRAMQLLLFWRVLVWSDVVHYHFNAFVLGDFGDELEYLRRLGKVIVFHFRGCDARYRTRNMATFPDLNICQECDYPTGSCDTDYQRKRLARARAFGDLFFATTPDLVRMFDGAAHLPFIPPIGVDLDSIPAAAMADGTFRIVTSSNHPGIDGVPYIRAAVERLRPEFPEIELVEIIQRPYRETLAVYKSADLFVGKLRMGYYNNSNIETMQMGVPNMCFVREEFLAGIPDCPIIVARPDTVYEKLRECLADMDALRRRGQEGPAFISKYHDPDALMSELTKHYDEAFSRRRKYLKAAVA